MGGTLLGLTDTELTQVTITEAKKSWWSLMSWTDRLSVALVLLSTGLLLFSVRMGPLYHHASEGDMTLDSVKEQQQLGDVAIREGKFAEAVQHFNLVATLRPKDPQARYNLGAALFRINDFQGAVAAFQQALKLNPNLPHLHYALGATFLNLRLEDDAIAQFYSAIQSDNRDLEAHTALARLLMTRGLTDEAIGEFEEVVRLAPQNGRGHYELAMADWKAASTGANSLVDVGEYLTRSGQELEQAEELGTDIDPVFANAVRQEIASRNKLLETAQ